MENNRLKKKEFIILIPSYNEFKSLKNICSKLDKIKFNYIVINDGSSDKTHQWLKKKKIQFINNKKNLGYEKSIIKGFIKVLSLKNYNYTVTMDGDGEHKIESLIDFIKKKRRKFDLAVFERKKFNRWSEKILSFFFNLRYNIKDPISGYKIYNLKKLNKIVNKISFNYLLVDVVYYFLKSKLKVINYSVEVKKRKDFSRVGNGLLVNIRILKLLKFIF